MGRHLAEVVAATRAAGDEVRYFAASVSAADSAGTAVPLRWSPLLIRFTPLRWARSEHGWLNNVEFDRAVASRLPPGRRLFGFQGSALATFRRARTLGYEELHLEAAGAHVDHARRRFDAAYRVHPLERDWLGARLLARTKAEYELADVIWINSEYSRETFLAAGVDPRKLRRRRLTVDPKYRPVPRTEPHERLNVVYIGSLSVTKGIPILIEAFSGLIDPDARLVLIGGSSSSGMRRFLEVALKRDRRISICPGDPLPHLRQADLCIHPSYCDGFGYGPAEALACGIPVAATEDTGMKEAITPGKNGWILPTGDVFSIVDVLRNPKLSTEQAIER
jgi:glycosyltransferase involved in cell wall biosynthesis